MGTHRGQKPSVSLVVAGGSRGVLLPCVQDCGSSVMIIHSCHDLFCQKPSLYISLWLGYDIFLMCHGAIPCGYADSSYRSMNEGPLHFLFTYMNIVPP